MIGKIFLVYTLVAFSPAQAEPLPCEGGLAGIADWIWVGGNVVPVVPDPDPGFPCQVDVRTSVTEETAFAWLAHQFDASISAMRYTGGFYADLDNMNPQDEWAFLSLELEYDNTVSELVMALVPDSDAASGWLVETSMYIHSNWILIDQHPLDTLDGVGIDVAWDQRWKTIKATVENKNVFKSDRPTWAKRVGKPTEIRLGLVYPLMDAKDGNRITIHGGGQQTLANE